MKYMLLIHQGTTPTPLDPEAWATLSEDEQQAIYAAYKEVNATPGVTPGNGLQPPETATTVRVQDGRTGSQAPLNGPGRDLDSGMNAQLAPDPLDMSLGSALGDKQPVGDLVVAVKLGLNVRPIELKSLPKILARCLETLETLGTHLASAEFRLITQFYCSAGR